MHIQKGVNYSPKHHFYPFDILVITQNDKLWLSWDRFCECVKESGFELCASAVVEGDLQGLIRTFDPNVFETTIPGRLGLDKPEKNYIAEGVVLRLKYGERLCVKYKADKFGEIDGSTAMSLKRDISLPMSIKDVEQELLNNIFNGDRKYVDFIYGCINENRFDNVKSKIGQIVSVYHKNYNKCIGSFAADVWTESNAKYETDLNEICNKTDSNQIKKFITCCIREFVNSILN